MYHRKPHSRLIQLAIGTAMFLAVVVAMGVASAVSLASTDRSSPAPGVSEDQPHPAISLEAKAQPLTVKVRSGDTLSRLARRTLGHSRDWPLLWYANRHQVDNPNVILVGQTLRISHQRLEPWIVRRAMRAIPKPPAPRPVVTHGSATHLATTTAPRPTRHHRTRHISSAPAVTYSGASSSFQACVIARESGGNPRAVNPTSGAGGLYQFLPSTWAALGFPGLPEDASVAMQNAAFQKAYAESGTSPWAPYDGC